ncbi:hypothetical protein [Clostridium botulinum]|uniref:hypothetical protein n=1 Tax=Clostridium botulinum TaxID=1491 RepID=UPI001C9AAFA2|nr:hypothetical protein [Clostridium botulinum]MBY6838853.1 hypothetical protein [Clostridium botulinum]
MAKKLSNLKIKELFKDFELYIINEDEITNSKSKINSKDIDGYKYCVSASDLRQYKKDNNKIDKFSKFNPNTIENIKLYLMLNDFENRLLSTQYVNSDSKLIFTCKTCGQPYEVSFKHFRNSNQINCKKCAKIINTQKDRFSIEYITEYFKSKNLKLLDTEYTGVKQRLKALTTDGYKIKISYNSLSISKGNYEIFSKHNPYTIDNLKKYIKTNNLSCKLLTEEYKNKKSKLIFKCECDNIFETTLNSFLHENKTRCDKCSKKKSRLEYLTEKYLIKNNIEYSTQYRFADCRNKKPLPFDFAIFNNGLECLIEVDGQQHEDVVHFNGITYKEALESHLRTKENDDIKNKYCKDNNIKLIRISYNQFKNDNYVNILNKEMHIQG